MTTQFDLFSKKAAAVKRAAPKVFVTPVCRVSLIREAEFSYGEQAMKSPEIAKDFFLRYFHDRGEDREVFLCLSLDTKLVPIHLERVSTGTLDASLVHPREVFKSAVLVGAAAVAVAHNHPSGDPTPSREDKLVTKRLEEAGDVLGIKVVDHVVVGRDCAISIKEVV